MAAGLEFGRTWRVPRASIADGGLVAESEDEDAGLDLFGREQVEAAGLLPELDLCSGRGGERDIGQSVAKRGVACLVEGGEPAVEEAAGGGVGDEAHLVAEAGQANEDGGVNGADVVSPVARAQERRRDHRGRWCRSGMDHLSRRQPRRFRLWRWRNGQRRSCRR